MKAGPTADLFSSDIERDPLVNKLQLGNHQLTAGNGPNSDNIKIKAMKKGITSPVFDQNG